jgi:galactonate dehydratase
MEGHKIATMAEAFFVSVAPHNPLSPLSTVVALHLDTVVPNFLIQETSDSPDRDKILSEPIEIVRDGYMVPPSGPGWGVELNEDFLRSRPYAERRMFPMQFADDGSIIDL